MKKVNIIGYGFVGQATAIGLKRLGYKVSAYDIVEKENIYKVKEFDDIFLNISDGLPSEGINIVCIADKVLEDGQQEIGNVVKILEKMKDKGIVILRTTIIPRLLFKLNFDFYWVEFLHERNAIEEFMNPERVVVGRRTDKEFPLKDCFKSICYCSPEEASHIKYLSNVWNGMRIAFVNEFGDNLIDEKIDKEKVVSYFFQNKKYLKWGNAFGGHCLPKDVRAYSKEYPNLQFLSATNNANKIHRKRFPNLKSIY